MFQALYLVITTMYRRSEQVTFFGLGYVSGCIAAPVGGLIAFGSGQLYASHLSNIPGWKWFVLIAVLVMQPWIADAMYIGT